MPSGNIDKPVIEDNRDGTVTIKYEPREEGTHELALKYNGEHIQGKAKKSQNLHKFYGKTFSRFTIQVSC